MGGDLSYDVGIAQLAVPLEDQLGARGIVFNKPPKSTYQIFGYPGLPNPPYNGERLVACEASFFSLQYTGHPFSTVACPCDMQEGSSGGGWVTPAGAVASVVSHGSCEFDPSTCGQIAGPYFGDTTKALYNKAGGSAECPPARQAAKQAGKQVKKAKKVARHHSYRRAAKRLKKASRKFNKAKEQARRHLLIAAQLEFLLDYRALTCYKERREANGHPREHFRRHRHAPGCPFVFLFLAIYLGVRPRG